MEDMDQPTNGQICLLRTKQCLHSCAAIYIYNIRYDTPLLVNLQLRKSTVPLSFLFSPVGASYPNSLVWLDPSELSEVRWSHTARTAHQLPSKEGCPYSRSLVLRVEWVGEKEK